MGGSGHEFLPLVLSIGMTLTTAAYAGGENFDGAKPGTLPEDWTCGVTGKGSPVWKVEADNSAPSQPNVLKQSGSGTFPWCVKPSVRIADGFVEVKFKPLAGREDQAGGVLWRFKDGNNYYIARANALENNVRLYTVKGGKRQQIASYSGKVTGNAWHVFRAVAKGDHLEVFWDGAKVLDHRDATFADAGAVGVWTKADSVTYFDDLSVKPAP